ncbi:MAG: adenylate/guanylate cyclase domain-containing protein [Methylococcales bacterium]|nr:adenylate/guanylate cyclase domain-containing protein [Methylococcales bacterium]
MASEREQVEIVILFADVVGSTSLFEQLGDVLAREKVSGCLDTLIGIVESNGGKLIKTIGDEVMCTFPDPNVAFQSACFMQEEISAQATRLTAQGGVPLAIRVGLHYGPALEEAGDVYGDAVNVAARVVGLCKPEQIMTTGQLIAAVNPMFAASTRLVEKTAVKGRQDEIEIIEVMWGDDEEDVTQMVSGLFTKKEEVSASVVIKYQNSEVVVSDKNACMTMGRGMKNTLVVNSGKASRLHAKVEFRRGKFFLIDQSTNGTYVTKNGEGQVFVRRDETMLQGNGLIDLGGDDQVDAITYDCLGV